MVVSNVPILDVAPDLCHFEPVETSERGAGTGDAYFDGCITPIRGGANDLAHPVDVCGHFVLLSRNTVHKP